MNRFNLADALKYELSINIPSVSNEEIFKVCDELKDKGFYEYLKKEFPKPNIRNRSDEEIRNIVHDVINYLGLSHTVDIKINRTDLSGGRLYQKTAAGLYDNSPTIYKNITINIDEGYNDNNILAIICHECTHYFMQVNGLNINNMNENEKKTDITACLIGFNEILYRGYDARLSEKQTSMILLKKIKLGYINFRDCYNIKKARKEYLNKMSF